MIPTLGMGATIGIGSDCYPATVIEVSANGKTIKVQRDNYTPSAGYDYFGNQVHTFSMNPDGITEVWTLRNHGRYVRKGDKKGNGFYISFGARRAYSDPSF